MSKNSAHLLIKIDHKNPLDLIEFTTGLLSISNQYSSFMANKYPDVLDEQFKLYIRKIEEGSIITELVHMVSPFISGMDNINIFIDFINHFKAKVSPFFKENGRNPELNVKDLNNFNNALRLANQNSNNKLTMAAAEYSDGKRYFRQEFHFDGSQSLIGLKNIENQIQENEKKGQALHQKVLMTFYQTNKNEVLPEKRIGEKAIIESISPKALPVIFVSKLVGDKVKSETLEGDGNPYKKGFIVDVNVATHKGIPACYSVVQLHEVFELDE